MTIAFDAWSPEHLKEFEAAHANPRVGSRLVSETDDFRIWSISLKPGERLPFHKHVLDYFWTAVTPGRARSHVDDGSVREMDYVPGQTQHHHYGPGEYKIHDLENVGSTELVFTTVEIKKSANPPLRIDP